jgi:hypothetical protein
MISELDRLIGKANAYLNSSPKLPLIQLLYRVLSQHFSILGIDYGIEEGRSDGARKEVVQILCEYRDRVRKHAIEKDFAAILAANDELRDVVLPRIGVRLEDGRPGEPAVWLLDDPEEIIKEKAAKLEEAKKKQESKRKAE